ncbi:MAG: type I-C CRISPR-associated protein Cas8c/Csd1 [Thermoguttaceae bacterium]|nr:type I-C CRISPR-associated protein Cas8c/Csd1 [Thermoguttaceae bacterium]
MNWKEALIRLYESNESIAGEEKRVNNENDKNGSDKGKKVVLAPLYHDIYNAIFEVHLNQNGELIGINEVPKYDQDTIIPVTIDSASRASTANAPHSLSDQLVYLSDHWKPEKFNKYIDCLEAWCNSPFSHPKLKAVLTYIKKNSLLADINQILHVELSDSNLKKLEKENRIVRFRVSIPNDTENSDACWTDKSLFECYIQYIRSDDSLRESLCYITGKQMTCANKHSKKVFPLFANAKLISSNDKSNYTYRGRFTNDFQAASIGYDSSQKIHLALKWIYSKQGTHNFDNFFVSWETDLIPMPDIYDGTSDYLIIDDGEDLGLSDDSQDELMPDSTGYIKARTFNQALDGYRHRISDYSRMVLMTFDVITPGRISITGFREMATSDYLDKINDWHKTCSWRHSFYKNKKRVFYNGIPSLYDCIRLIYGRESGANNPKIELKSKGNKINPVLKQGFQRLLPCILDGKQIPIDIVRTAIQRASSPMSYQRYNWEQVLAVACSLVKKYHFEKSKHKEDFTMDLDESCTDRSYLYGRLLAVADRIEYQTFDKNDDKRQTNAKRFMSSFAKRPFQVWQKIEEKLQPYLMKLSKPSRIFYSQLLDTIHNQFEDTQQYASSESLNGLYLLGFHSQAMSMKKKDDSSDNKLETLNPNEEIEE